MSLAVIDTTELAEMLRGIVREELDARDKGDVLTKAELGKEYNWSASTINRYMRSGMPSHGPGRPRFRRTEIDAWLDNHRNSN